MSELTPVAPPSRPPGQSTGRQQKLIKPTEFAEYRGCNYSNANKVKCVEYLRIIRDIIRDTFYKEHPDDLQIILNELSVIELGKEAVDTESLPLIEAPTLFKNFNAELAEYINSDSKLLEKAQQDPKKNSEIIKKLKYLIEENKRRIDVFAKADNKLTEIYHLIYSQRLNSPLTLKVQTEKIQNFHNNTIKQKREVFNEKLKKDEQYYHNQINSVKKWLEASETAVKKQLTAAAPNVAVVNSQQLLAATLNVAIEESGLVKHLKLQIEELKEQIKQLSDENIQLKVLNGTFHRLYDENTQLKKLNFTLSATVKQQNEIISQSKIGTTPLSSLTPI